MAEEIKNAVIRSTMLGLEDHGIPTCSLMLDYSGSGQGFGGYDLRHHGIKMVTEICRVVGVEKWESLPGKVCRVKSNGGRLHAIGNIIEDRWYEPEAGE